MVILVSLLQSLNTEPKFVTKSGITISVTVLFIISVIMHVVGVEVKIKFCISSLTFHFAVKVVFMDGMLNV